MSAPGRYADYRQAILGKETTPGVIHKSVFSDYGLPATTRNQTRHKPRP
jgi:hypothetical protein